MILVLGHRFNDLAIETDVVGPDIELVDGRHLDDVSLRAALEQADAILLGTGDRIDGERIASLKRCRGIVRYGVGLDNIDVDAAKAKGMAVVPITDYCIDEVSDHTVALVLAAARGLFTARESARQGKWGVGVMAGKQRLSHQVAGVIGFGRIGVATARKLRSFGMTVLVSDPLVADERIQEYDMVPAALERLLGESDYVILHCPLVPATRHLINGETLSAMKNTAWLVNTGRGGLVDHAALLTALNNGEIAGAALDVLEQEPPPADSPLLNHERVIVTPHVAWYSEQALEQLRRSAAGEARRIIEQAAG